MLLTQTSQNTRKKYQYIGPMFTSSFEPTIPQQDGTIKLKKEWYSYIPGSFVLFPGNIPHFKSSNKLKSKVKATIESPTLTDTIFIKFKESEIGDNIYNGNQYVETYKIISYNLNPVQEMLNSSV